LTPRRNLALGGVLALAGPVLLAVNTWAYCATVDFTLVDPWRRLWNDLALATASWVDATYGQMPAEVTGPEADSAARGLIMERIANQGMRATRPLETARKTGSFVAARLGPERKPYDDRGRAVLLAAGFRILGGVAPFLILWLGFLVAAPVLAWTALELWRAGRARSAALAALLFGLSPFLAETLALGRYPVGFYLAAVLLILPLAVYARLHPAPTVPGLVVRVLLASALLSVCVFCRSSAAVLLPGFVLAAWLGACRVRRAWGHRLALTVAAALLLGLPSALVPGSQQNDMWQPMWEGLGDFDRSHDFTWSDKTAQETVARAGVAALWTPQSEAVLRAQVLETIRAEPGWYALILVRRLLSTVSLWRLWPFGPVDGDFIRRQLSPNEGVIDKYWTYTATVDHLGITNQMVELPVSLLLAPSLLLAFLAWKGRRAAAAREALVVLACPAIATLALPVLITTAGGHEGQAFGLVHLFAAALLADVLWARGPTRVGPARAFSFETPLSSPPLASELRRVGQGS
jgi:hypothetical protein